MKNEFTVKSYPKSELAQLYFPYSEAHVAQNHLNSWIRAASYTSLVSRNVKNNHLKICYFQE